MRKGKTDPVQKWIEAGFRGLMVCVCGLIVFSYQELNTTMKELTTVTRAIELRVTTIEAERAMNKDGYKLLQQDVQNAKVDLSQLTVRVQTLADFVANTFKATKK